jgi:uncharacterized protein
MLDVSRDRRAGSRCPTCHRPATWAANPARPFSSLTCRLVDLGHWLNETDRVPGQLLPPEASLRPDGGGE